MLRAILFLVLMISVLRVASNPVVDYQENCEKLIDTLSELLSNAPTNLEKITGYFLNLAALVTSNDGFELPHIIARVDMTVRDLTDYLLKNLAERGININADIVSEIKKNLCGSGR